MVEDKKLPKEFDSFFGLTYESDIVAMFSMVRSVADAEALYKEIQKFPELAAKFIAEVKEEKN